MGQNEQIISRIIAKNPLDKAEFDAARTEICSDLGIMQPPNRELIVAYKKLLKEGKIKENKLIEELLVKAGVRTQSGIAIITSLVKPYMCPGKCVYCPTEVRMPKSYIATEPAAARALRLDFSPYEQMARRIEMLEGNGHKTDKIEFIIKGGTWNAYPLRYQYWFILESFRAANNCSPQHLNTLAPETDAQIKNQNSLETYKLTNLQTQLTDQSPIEELQAALEIEQTKNETSDHRIIGITLETRPDAIAPRTIAHMRRMGCTRIELGLQAPDDDILKLIKRGHTVEQFREAMKLLREAGFKVDLHFMPDLPSTTPEHDVTMYKSLFSDPGLKPDMVKIYPNTVIKSAELYQWFLDGRYKPYGEEGLFAALLEMKLATPRYCRISRLIRDIPETEIEAGNKITNLREALEKELHRRGQKCVCLRCREISRQQKQLTNLQTYKLTNPQLFIETYDTIGGTEYFLTFEDPERIAVYGFLRLRISTEQQNEKIIELIPEIKGCAFIRELHVYGQLVSIGKHDDEASQHKGLGRQLVEAAEKIAKENGFEKVAIISGVGVRDYYRKLGYGKVGTYMVKQLQ
ncbi:MAG: tRNA uridine(34) 5-carboxymethylaminomethyl modification radical SAM/GNAT enzyme Elp3 [Candidatus Magasanikbacteria bacterium]|nr:tRNA uridine(34) 5-carboxymethylaminomethyl modification radical SAM/GNAT enzyme Elp3 [Candidatus Magasanikbacteria bacterium]